MLNVIFKSTLDFIPLKIRMFGSKKDIFAPKLQILVYWGKCRPCRHIWCIWCWMVGCWLWYAGCSSDRAFSYFLVFWFDNGCHKAMACTFHTTNISISDNINKFWAEIFNSQSQINTSQLIVSLWVVWSPNPLAVENPLFPSQMGTLSISEWQGQAMLGPIEIVP